MKTLDEIGHAQGTDQASNGHDYLRRLEPFFAPLREQEFNLLELGVAGGASLRTWHEYFTKAKIWGIDHNPQSWRPQGEAYPRMIVLTEDATTPKPWQKFERLPLTFSIIIDDASHYVVPTMEALNIGFELLTPGGLWVIEDTHAHYLPDYRRGNALRAMQPNDTVMDGLAFMCKSAIDNCGIGQTGAPDKTTIEWLHWSKSLIIIKKAQ